MSNLLVKEGCSQPIRSIQDLEWQQLPADVKLDGFNAWKYGRVAEKIGPF